MFQMASTLSKHKEVLRFCHVIKDAFFLLGFLALLQELSVAIFLSQGLLKSRRLPRFYMKFLFVPYSYTLYSRLSRILGTPTWGTSN